MPMQTPHTSIALLATGDEIISGDLTDTNSAHIAKILEANRYFVRTHLGVRDDLRDLTHAISWLKTQHRVMITIGGLGPTQDDLTRQALSEALNIPLIFHKEAWERIENKFQMWQKPCPQINQRQAYFLQGATIWHNTEGTADAALFHTEQFSVITLPGPPRECFPLIERHLLPFLETLDIQCLPPRHTWLLLGQGESYIAQLLEPLCPKMDITMAFRASYPYVEVKTHTPLSEKQYTAIEKVLHPWLVSRKRIPLSEQFLLELEKTNTSLSLSFSDSIAAYLAWLPKSHLKVSAAPTEHSICIWIEQETNEKASLHTRFEGNSANTPLPRKTTPERYLYAKEWLSFIWLKWGIFP